MNAKMIEAVVNGIGPVIRDQIAKLFAPVELRVAVLEKREPVKGEPGNPGQDGTPGEIGQPGPAGEKGMPGEPGAAGGVGEPGPAGPAGQPGPTGERGEKGMPGEPGAAGKDGASGLPGEKGEPGSLGVPGEKGMPGEDGRDGQPGVPGTAGRDGSNGKDGAPGLNGKDGLGIEHLDVLHDGERTFTFKWSAGDRVEERCFVIPIVIDRGVWKDGEFKKGDGVTWGGSFFIAQKDTTTKPETKDSDWRLAIKRGRDGKDGKPGEKGQPGSEGKPGRDLTQVRPDGRKW